MNITNNTGQVMISMVNPTKMLLQTLENMFCNVAKLIPICLWRMVKPMKISWKALILMNCTFNSVLKKLLLKDSAKTSLEPNLIQSTLDPNKEIAEYKLKKSLKPQLKLQMVKLTKSWDI